MWKANSSNSLSNNFADWLQMSNFLLLNSNTPTHISHTGSQSILDLSICIADIFHQVKSFVNKSSFESDHNPVITEWSNINFAPRNIKSINWSNIMQQTSEILSSTLQDFSNIIAKLFEFNMSRSHSTIMESITQTLTIPSKFKKLSRRSKLPETALQGQTTFPPLGSKDSTISRFTLLQPAFKKSLLQRISRSNGSTH
ncbi:hypothetical protein AVEN_155889-1 [Araneus ventricosus]|uniref:Endonuclease/exonuclease/phosphatase domain-containing protein n=1 Tax=Araneus ventricosus TaxID=182803 RepID=A0A4Y2UXQ9_ARAVE|nr:hypothetical protein AVEN_155889-1 [Araneus ventricosus]